MNREGDEPVNYKPQVRKPPNPYQFSTDEMRVIKECNRESFFQRCVPLAGLFGFGTYFGIKTGYIRGNPRFGAIPKVTVAAIVGYFLGKFSYQQKCAEKLMQLPNSQIGEMLRQRRKGFFQETLEPGIGAGMTLAPFSNIPNPDAYSDVGPSSDIDTTRPSYDGLDDSHRPSMDNPIYEEEMPPLQKKKRLLMMSYVSRIGTSTHKNESEDIRVLLLKLAHLCSPKMMNQHYQKSEQIFMVILLVSR